MAGLSVALVLIPQALAYAELAGMPAYHGLYAAALAPIAASFFASSPYLQTGPVAMTSLLTFGALAVIAPVQSAEYVGLAALLAVVVGVTRIALSLARLGWLAFLMSEPVVLGFTAGASILIVASQLPTAVGVVTAPGPSGSLLARAWWAAIHPGAWEAAAVALALTTAAIIVVGRRLHALFPGVLVAVVVGIAYSALAGYAGPIVGAVPTGFPPLSVALPWHAASGLLLPGAVIALVGFAEPAAIARTFAAQDRQRWNADAELLSQGVANVVAGFSSGFPVGGSFTRSAINRSAGGRSRWSGAITGVGVLVLLPAAGVLSGLPRAVLAAIVIGAVVKLIRPRALWELRRVSWTEAGVAWTTFLLTLALAPRIERAVLAGIGLSLLIHVWREREVHIRATFADGTLRLEPSGVLFFGSAPALHQAFMEELSAHPGARRLEVDLRQLGRIDLSGALALGELMREADAAGLAVALTDPPPQARRLLERTLPELPRRDGPPHT